jgi:hypothetical protein
MDDNLKINEIGGTIDCEELHSKLLVKKAAIWILSIMPKDFHAWA